ncbi:MAG: hypothetical protein AAF604_04130 [Acidobacteriota bacterium]
MRSLRPLHAACLAVLLLGLSATLYKIHFPPGPVADEAAYLMITQSLWHDHDLTYDHRDLRRSYRIWDQGPYGLILFTDDGGETMYFGKPLAYSAAAVPFYAVFGPQGLVILNMALYLAMLAIALALVRREAPEGAAVGLWVGGFFFASAGLVYVFWMQPEVFNMACVFLPLALGWSLRQLPSLGRRHLLALVAAGALLAAAFVSKEPLILLGAPLGIDLLWRRRFRGLAALALGAALGAGLLIGLQWKLSDHWSPYRDVQRRSFEATFPLEVEEDLWSLYKGTSFGSWSGVRPSSTLPVLARNAVYFLIGRHTGLLPYFPFGLACLVMFCFAPRNRYRWLVLLSVVAYCGLLFLLRPGNYHGGAGFIGNRYFASIYPVLLLVAGPLRARRALWLPFAAAGLWTASVVAVPVMQIAPEFTLQTHVRSRPFQALPLELTLLPSGRIPGYWQRNWGQGTWVLRRDNFFAQEKHPEGIWVRGDSKTEVVVVSQEPLEALRFKVISPLPENVLTLDSGSHRQVIRFDSEAKRQGVPVELPVKPVARNLGFYPAGPPDYYYRFTLETTDGWVPARMAPGKSRDMRYLSVFLSFSGDAP